MMWEKTITNKVSIFVGVSKAFLVGFSWGWGAWVEKYVSIWLGPFEFGVVWDAN